MPATTWSAPRHLLPALALAAAVLALGALGAQRELPAARMAPAAGASAPGPHEAIELARKLDRLAPRGVYVTIDAVENRLQVRRGATVLRDAVCSSGTGSVLEDPRSGRRWVFDTPRGARTVLEKRRDPVWTRPEWSYVESGEPLPARWSDRIDDASLGDFALYLGDGYMIHGTLYQRYLGRNVTHGCVRLGDDDLAYVYRTVPVGATVLIY